jgi:hypothetical protein
VLDRHIISHVCNCIHLHHVNFYTSGREVLTAPGAAMMVGTQRL